ncbi:outer membrane beta-barrel protein [Rufibacter glacialis]|uniref:Outer membrane beta-barrel protein n=1 Tax=Rufibacter glacialis TaxID=1259555 RepID=A0A5M8QB33_9BACT|nr:outer membrane beta-barrel protein [Rufibacter glacialis]KAA6433169.1 porin family protein [Rufibacter glacialis]GGK76798.1 hypothetical protein GCM10011405_25760 [Rufibacter glacialis]
MLKKFFLAASFCFTLGSAAMAQDGGGIKPAAGEVTAEVQLSLTDGSTVGLGLNQLRGRYFLSPTTAVRASFTMEVQNDDFNDDFNRTSTLLQFAPGIEKHFAGTDRLSPYVGGEIRITKLYSSQESDNLDIEGAWSNSGNSNNLTNRNYFGWGLGVVAGADYYFAKHVYLGVEFGLGIQYRTEGEVDIKPSTGPTRTLEGENGFFRLGSSVNSGLRLGFVF